MIGRFVALPLLLVMFVLYLVGSAVVFVLVGERLLDAAVLAAVPLLGGLVNFVVNAVGVGAIVYHWRHG